MSGDEFVLTRRTFTSGSHQLTWSAFAGGLVDPGRTIVCIPGYASAGESFARLRPLAARYDLRLVTFDEKDHDRAFDLTGCLARRIVEFARQFHRPVLLGTSFGGTVALRAAASLGTGIRGVILISSFVTHSHLRGLSLLRRLGLLGDVGRLAEALQPITIRIAGGSALDRGAAAEIRREAAAITEAERRFRLDAAITADLRSIVPAVRVPALVIHGTADHIVPLSAARQLARALPAAHLEVIPGAGHLPYLTHAREVAALIDDFAERLFALKEMDTGRQAAPVQK